MTDWTAFAVIGQNLVTYMMGSYTNLGIGVSLMFLILFMAVGIKLQYAFPMVLPIMGGFLVAGWFGDVSWVVNIVLLVVASIYAYAMYSLFS